MIERAVIFDLDGTLWDSSVQVIEAWNSIIKKYPETKAVVTPEKMATYMGKVLEEISAMLFDDISKDRGLEIMTECSDYELEYLKDHSGVPYEDLEETLKALPYPLFIVSNCQSGYIETFLECCGLGKYFKDFECSGNTGNPKGENILEIIRRNDIKNAVYVGDTQGDCNASQVAGIPFIFAEYGFGNADRFDKKIKSIKELAEINLFEN